MSYKGHYAQGESILLVLQCTNAAGAPTVPDNPPAVSLRSDSGLVASYQMPVLDRYQATGLFAIPVRLNGSYPAGNYSATYFATAGGFNVLEIDTFSVVAGGDPEGALLTHHYLDRAEAKFLVQQTQAGSLLLRRNPSV